MAGAPTDDSLRRRAVKPDGSGERPPREAGPPGAYW